MEVCIVAAIVSTLKSATKLTCIRNRKKSESLIKCLQAVKAPLQAIDVAERDRIQVSHKETLELLKEVIDQAHALLTKQTQSQGTITSAFNSSRVREEFKQIQVDLEMHMGALNVSLGVLSGLKIQEGLDIIKQENHEAEQELRDLVHDSQAITHANQGITHDNQAITHANQRITHDNQAITHKNQGITHEMLNNSSANQEVMLNKLDMLAEQLNISSNAINNISYNITNDNSTTTITTNNVADSHCNRIAKKPEPYVKRKTKLHDAAEKGSLPEVQSALRTFFIDHEAHDGSTALLLAVQNSHDEVVKELLLEGVDFTVDANQKAWWEVIKKGDVHLIPRFAEGGMNVNLQLPPDWIKDECQVKDFIFDERGNLTRVPVSCTALHFSCMKGHLEITEALIHANADVNVKDNRGWTPLHCCCDKGHNDITKALIHANADVNIKNNDGRTPLQYSCENGHLEITKALIHANADVNVKHTTGWTPLHYSCIRGHNEITEALIHANADVNVKDDDGRTPLHLSCDRGHLEITKALIHGDESTVVTMEEVKKLLKTYANSEELGVSKFVGVIDETKKKKLNDDFKGLVDELCENVKNLGINHVDVARNLSSIKAKVRSNQHRRVNVKDGSSSSVIHGWTPLHYSCRRGHLEITEALIHANADVNIKKNDGMTPLHLSCMKGHLEITKALIHANADVNVKKNDGFTPLHYSCNLEITEALIHANADVNVKKNDGQTPLHLSCGRGHLEITKALIHANADVNVKHVTGRSPLHLSCENGHLEITKALIHANADVNIKMNRGWTPLHYSCERGHLDITKALIHANADMNVKNIMDDKVWTPLHVSYDRLNYWLQSKDSNRNYRIKGHLEITRTLINANADFEGFSTDEVIDLLRKIANDSEEERKQAADDKATAEELRKQAADDKATAEELRKQATSDKATAEELRKQATSDKATAEELRKQAA